MQRRLAGAALLAVSFLACTGHPQTSRTPSGSPNRSPSAPTRGSTPIHHVVIVFQENRSFDEVLGRLCLAAKAKKISRDPCDGASKGTLSDGTVIPLSPATDIVNDISPSVVGQQKAIDGGKMDGFSLTSGCTAETNPPYACYSSYEPSQIPNLAALATAFTLSDRTFEFRSTPSWAGHMVLGSATLDGFEGRNPTRSTFTKKIGPGSGCDSFRDSPWWNGKQYVLVPSCVPDRAGEGPYRRSPVRYVPTIFGRLDSVGLSWKIYGGGGGTDTALGMSGYGFTICPTFYECQGSAQRANLVPASNVLTDAANGNLPAYSVVTPTYQNSQHPPQSMAVGDNWIGKVVTAVETGPNWNSTAIFIVYDDCGCFYDHVNPLRYNRNWGVRVPMVIVSPYARAGYTDSTPATFMSLLAFTEHTFQLTPLNAEDRRAYDFARSFNYRQAPLPPVKMVTTAISAGELAWLARQPQDEDEPT
jgi:phospholipase C